MLNLPAIPKLVRPEDGWRCVKQNGATMKILCIICLAMLASLLPLTATAKSGGSMGGWPSSKPPTVVKPNSSPTAPRVAAPSKPVWVPPVRPVPSPVRLYAPPPTPRVVYTQLPPRVVYHPVYHPVIIAVPQQRYVYMGGTRTVQPSHWLDWIDPAPSNWSVQQPVYTPAPQVVGDDDIAGLTAVVILSLVISGCIIWFVIAYNRKQPAI